MQGGIAGVSDSLENLAVFVDNEHGISARFGSVSRSEAVRMNHEFHLVVPVEVIGRVLAHDDDTLGRIGGFQVKVFLFF